MGPKLRCYRCQMTRRWCLCRSFRQRRPLGSNAAVLVTTKGVVPRALMPGAVAPVMRSIGERASASTDRGGRMNSYLDPRWGIVPEGWVQCGKCGRPLRDDFAVMTHDDIAH